MFFSTILTKKFATSRCRLSKTIVQRTIVTEERDPIQVQLENLLHSAWLLSWILGFLLNQHISRKEKIGIHLIEQLSVTVRVNLMLWTAHYLSGPSLQRSHIFSSITNEQCCRSDVEMAPPDWSHPFFIIPRSTLNFTSSKMPCILLRVFRLKKRPNQLHWGKHGNFQVRDRQKPSMGYSSVMPTIIILKTHKRARPEYTPFGNKRGPGYA